MLENCDVDARKDEAKKEQDGNGNQAGVGGVPRRGDGRVAVAVNPAKPASKWLNVIPMCVFARISRSPRVAILPQPISPSMVCARFCGLFSMLHSCLRGLLAQRLDGIEASGLNYEEQCRKGGSCGGRRCRPERSWEPADGLLRLITLVVDHGKIWRGARRILSGGGVELARSGWIAKNLVRKTGWIAKRRWVRGVEASG